MDAGELVTKLEAYAKRLEDNELTYYAAMWENFTEKIKAETLKGSDIRSCTIYFNDPDGVVVAINKDGDVCYGTN